MPEPARLSQAIPAYPEDHPQTLAELLTADPATISDDLAWLLRKQTMAATRSAERHTVRGPGDTLDLLANGYALHPWEGAWVCYALSATRQVVLVNDEKGGLRSLRKATRLLPKAEDLPDIPPSAYRGPSKPAWLVLYGGSPEILSRDHVARGLTTLQRRVHVADICFYVCDPDTATPPTLWSVRAGTGAAKGSDTPIPFPDPDLLEEVRNP